MRKSRNDTLDLIKLFAAYMVVFIHVYFYGQIGVWMNAIARFAVPLFFVTSGYFTLNKNTDTIKKRIKNILHMIAFSEIVYAIYAIVSNLHNIDGIAEYFSKYLQIGTWLSMLIWNVSPASFHLWFLFALLYVYVIHYFVVKWHINEKLMYIAMFVLLIANILFGEILHIFDFVISDGYFRSFWLTGIPFFYLGMFVNKHKNCFRNINTVLCVILIVVGAVASGLARQYFGLSEAHIGSMLILFALVTLAIKNEEKTLPKWINTLSACSTNIYIFHIFVYNAVWSCAQHMQVNVYSFEYLMIQPLIVCAVSTILALIWNKISTTTKQFKIEKRKD